MESLIVKKMEVVGAAGAVLSWLLLLHAARLIHRYTMDVSRGRLFIVSVLAALFRSAGAIFRPR